MAENEVNWSCSGDSWRSGGTSISDKKLTSYDFMDQLLRAVSNKNTFPNLKQIVLCILEHHEDALVLEYDLDELDYVWVLQLAA